MYLMCCLPFMADWIISMRHSFVTYGTEMNSSGCTVTEVSAENEENFINVGSQNEST
jgi:hypothetical protein